MRFKRKGEQFGEWSYIANGVESTQGKDSVKANERKQTEQLKKFFLEIYITLHYKDTSFCEV